MTPRELIAYARRDDWDHAVYVFHSSRQHLWRSPEWEVSAEPDENCWHLSIAQRWVHGDVGYTHPVVTAEVTSVDQAAALLAAYDLIRSEVPA